MADKENCMRVTRLAKKRAAEAMSTAGVGIEQQRPSKKRVVLGEVKSISTNASSNKRKDSLSEPQKQQNVKNRRKVKENLQASVKKPEDVGIDVHADSNDPQMCTAYVSDIYEYLHKMEVSLLNDFSFLISLFVYTFH